ncbi:conjugal transfer protein TrbG/VirB9/CagX [Caballeronia calidae]|uniref:Conjugal transfer protein TrbG/VirB9/CagX n=1 Tax=Caballeronia calidae TaxID=1777139 RepID=A0A158EEG6_9BURK|nr:TrbG/VirB9 family P-type conjugative transfer protein [Caballeronia calidae]SAL05214.1 conjugal transfer protein TrbG/VirB9/CagX [Caballeronia calidae]
MKVMRQVYRVAVIAALLAGAACVVEAQAAQLPRAMPTDPRMRQMPYDANQVYEVTSVYGYTTTIEFAPSERILNTAVGDTIAWQIGKFRNHLVLKPVEPDAQTNLTVTTSNHVYYFNLSSSKKAADAVFAIRFVYPGDGNVGEDDVADGSASPMYMPPRVVNRNYLVSGNERALGLQRIFDDGQFTYFLTSVDRTKPFIYVVDHDGTEELANVRREGPYLVVEQMADRFTLRDGNQVLCVARASATRRMKEISVDAAH